MSKAIRIHEHGDTSVLRWEEVEVGTPGAGQVRIRQTAVGVNYIDTYHRTGLYPVDLPAVIGMEGAGVVEEIGPDVTEFRPGDRVAYSNPIGSYAEERLIPADRLVKLPEPIDARRTRIPSSGSRSSSCACWITSSSSESFSMTR